MTAAIDALADGGFGRLTVASVIERAHVSRKTFYDVFADRHDCFGAVFAHITALGVAAATRAQESQTGWLEPIRSGLGALLAMIDEEPIMARIWFVESLAGDAALLDQRARALSRAVDAVHLGRASTRGVRPPSRTVAEATVGGIAHVIHARLLEPSPVRFAALSRTFMYLIALPYLGPAQAYSELRLAPPRRPRRAASSQPWRPDRSLSDIRIRMTYRTIRTLGAIADAPGASNIEVSVRCGVADQGQISKLLSLLGGLGLIENRGAGSSVGASNAWHITPRGAELLEAATPPDALAGAPHRGSGPRLSARLANRG